MKIQITLSAEQIQLLDDSLVHSHLYDRLLKKNSLVWQELTAIVHLANDEVNNGMIRQASYKLVK